MILTTKEDFENALLKGEEIKHKTVFYTGELEGVTKPQVAPDKLKIGTYDPNIGVYAGELRGQQVWVALKDAPEQLDFEAAEDWCYRQGGHLPTIDELTVVYLNKDVVNDALVANGGEALKEDDVYKTASEYESSFSLGLYMSNGYREANDKLENGYVRYIVTLCN